MLHIQGVNAPVRHLLWYAKQVAIGYIIGAISRRQRKQEVYFKKIIVETNKTTKDGTEMTGQNDQGSKMALVCFGKS